jgi:para-aminobenzoate synthetase component 1
LPHAVWPAEVFEGLCHLPHSFFLDSRLPDSRLGRFSFLGAEPVAILSARGRDIWLRERSQGRWDEQRWDGNPFEALRDLLARAVVPPAASPVPFVGGLVGYLGYDLCHFVERLPQTVLDDIALPDLHFALYDAVAAYEHGTGRWYAASLSGEAGLRRAAAYLDAARPEPPQSESPATVGRVRPNCSREHYLDAVQRAKDYIAAGDIFQVNLSQRFQAQVAVGPVELYRRLARANPAPFAAYLALDEEDGAVLSSSPERFLNVVDRRVETRPIKGTRPRGRTPAEDDSLAAELLASAKDAAELTMIVDLERNDLGRVCDYSSVQVTEHKALERYASVFHLVSTVEGRLHGDRDLVDLLKATFPGGSITGAPKVRAMEIIDELEATRRSVYTGAIGYIGAEGTTDLNIAIRTILVHGDQAYAQVGGGVVADSDPAAEYQETLDKGQRLFQALGHAGS